MPQDLQQQGQQLHNKEQKQLKKQQEREQSCADSDMEVEEIPGSRSFSLKGQVGGRRTEINEEGKEGRR